MFRDRALGILVVVLVVAVAQPAEASKLPNQGPYAGVVVEGSTMVHTYSSIVPMQCILPVTYVVTLSYAPAGDTLVLSAAGVSATGSDGHAEVSFEAACSTTFTITVTGEDVSSVAAYEVSVSGGGPPR
jgi:hypothetical protein